jgi:hypothetical protein
MAGGRYGWGQEFRFSDPPTCHSIQKQNIQLWVSTYRGKSSLEQLETPQEF